VLADAKQQISALAFSPDGRWAFSGSNDQTIKLWNLAEIPSSGSAEIALIITLFPTADGEWIAWTPDGFFAASVKGARSIGYSINQGIGKMARYVSVDQLHDRFYRPDLIYAKLTRATGRASIVASTDAQPAAEGYQGHGVFTYVLLQALRHADGQFGNRDGYKGLFELAAYVNDQVPSITMDAFNFEQIPQVHMVGTDFPIGVVKEIGS